MQSISAWVARVIVAGVVGFAGAWTSPAQASTTYDEANLFYGLYDPSDDDGFDIEFDGNPTFYRLTGQSAFLQTLEFYGTSGGQLDGAVGGDVITYTEAFPPTDLTEYLTYAYFGVIELVGTDSNLNEVVLERSLVVGFREPADAVGQSIVDLFGYERSVIVDALTTAFDSDEFFDIMSMVSNDPATNAQMGLLTLTLDPDVFVSDPPHHVRSDEGLFLVAFLGGAEGDLGVEVGSIGYTVTRITIIPEPASATLLGGLGMWLLARRRRTA